MIIGPIIKALTVVAIDRKAEKIANLAKGAVKLAGKVADLVKRSPKIDE